jgi:hypothetical protein
MRLLLDECVPRPIKRDLTVHDVHHVVDKELRVLVPEMLAALAQVTPGALVKVGSW